jgi:hypothetical protein
MGEGFGWTLQDWFSITPLRGERGANNRTNQANKKILKIWLLICITDDAKSTD